MIRKMRGLTMAEYIVETTAAYFSGTEMKVDGHIEGFNNGREHGYIMHLHYYDDWTKNITIYVYNHRISDLPTITWEIGYGGAIYNDESYTVRTTQHHTLDEAVDAVITLAKYYILDIK